MPSIEHLRSAVFDTHVWIWFSAGHNRAEPLKPFKGQVLISAISVWEVAMLANKGRIHLNPTVEDWIQANLDNPVSLEPLSAAISVESCRLPEFHGDPADRMIVATAGLIGVPLVTADGGIIKWNREHRYLRVIEV